MNNQTPISKMIDAKKLKFYIYIGLSFLIF